jgi:hypothetical protein
MPPETLVVELLPEPFEVLMWTPSVREKEERGRLPLRPPWPEREERAKEWGEEGRP